MPFQRLAISSLKRRSWCEATRIGGALADSGVRIAARRLTALLVAQSRSEQAVCRPQARRNQQRSGEEDLSGPWHITDQVGARRQAPGDIRILEALVRADQLPRKHPTKRRFQEPGEPIRPVAGQPLCVSGRIQCPPPHRSRGRCSSAATSAFGSCCKVSSAACRNWGRR